jgi:hypothetical protein
MGSWQIGYLTFGSKVGSNIIAMSVPNRTIRISDIMLTNRYPATSFIIALGRLGIVLLVGLSYPLQCLPCRSCIYHMTSGLIKPKPEPTYPPLQPSFTDDGEGELDSSPDETDDGAEVEDLDNQYEDSDSEDDPLMPREDDGKPGVKRIGDMPRWKFVAITVGILVLGFTIAATVDELEIGECWLRGRSHS